jgi:methylglyoxal reductase
MNEIAPLSADLGATNAQLVIAWTLQQRGITFSLCGARNPQQAVENAKAGRLRPSPDAIAAIDRAAERQLREMDG